MSKNGRVIAAPTIAAMDRITPMIDLKRKSISLVIKKYGDSATIWFNNKMTRSLSVGMIFDE
jgi:hypothetical protein